MKRFCNILILFVFMVSLMYISVNAEIQISSSDHYKGNALVSLKIMKEGEFGEFSPDAVFSRGQLALAAVRLMGDMNNLEPVDTIFSDVTQLHEFSGYIKKAYGMGLMSGFNELEFMPDEQVTLSQIVAVMVKIIGAKDIAIAQGGYPNGYITVALNNSILNGGYGKNANITRGIAADILLNTMETEVYEMGIQQDGGRLTQRAGNTVLSKYLKLTNATGLLTQVDGTSLTGNNNPGGAEEYQIVIDNQSYTVKNKNYNDLLGFFVEFYYDEDGVIQYLGSCNNKNNVVILKTDDFLNIDTDKLTYELKDSDRQDELLLSPYITLIYNGRVKPDFNGGSIKNELLIPNAKAIFIDNNGDDLYDIVRISSFKNIVVKKVTNKKVYDYFGYDSLDLDKSDTSYKFKIFKDSKEINISDIKVNDSLSIAKSADNEYIEVYVNTEMVTGCIEEKMSDKINTVVINKQEYILSSEMVNAKENKLEITMNIDAIFTLGMDGTVVFIKYQSKDNYVYGYLVATKKNSPLEDVMQMKIYTLAATMKVFNLSKHIQFNNESINIDKLETKSEIFSDGKVKNQLIKYNLDNDGYLVGLKTALTMNGTIDSEQFTVNNLCGDPVGASAKWSDSSYSLRNNSDSNVQICTVADAVPIFVIPADINDDEKYYIGNNMMWADNIEVKGVDAYDIGKAGNAAVIVLNKVVPSISIKANDYRTNTKSAVFYNVTKVIDQRGEERYAMDVFYDGKRIKKIIARNLQFNNKKVVDSSIVSMLYKGDIFGVFINTLTGEVEGLVKYFTFENPVTAPNRAQNNDFTIYSHYFDRGLNVGTIIDNPNAAISLNIYDGLGTSYGYASVAKVGIQYFMRLSNYKDNSGTHSDVWNEISHIRNAEAMRITRNNNGIKVETIKYDDIDQGDIVFIVHDVCATKSIVVIRDTSL